MERNTIDMCRLILREIAHFRSLSPPNVVDNRDRYHFSRSSVRLTIQLCSEIGVRRCRNLTFDRLETVRRVRNEPRSPLLRHGF
jgi:hypothetical protein